MARPLSVIKIYGGLGNQMFQYAFAYSMKRRCPGNVVRIDARVEKKYLRHNGYELERLFGPLDIPYMSKDEARRLMKPFRRVKPRHGRKVWDGGELRYMGELYSRTGNCYLEGYWQHKDYILPFRDEFADIFRFRDISGIPAAIAGKVDSENSVGIHVRRGDYIGDFCHDGVCSLPYYEKAIQRLRGNGADGPFIIFSDDPQWCRQNIVPLLDGCDVSVADSCRCENSYLDMHLMSRCRHLVIANSSFSWWGAFLNRRGGDVMMPAQWLTGQDCTPLTVPGWTVIKVDGQ